MKVFFHASQSEISETELDINKQIYGYIEELGHEHTSDFFSKITREFLNSEDVEQVAKELWLAQKNNVKKADVIIFGPSRQSIGIGIVVQMAMSLSKPVIFMVNDADKTPFLIRALDYNKLQILECDESNYKSVLKKELDLAKKMVDKRFTLLLSPDVVEMLDDHYRRTGQTRSDYIRDLIRHDQEQRIQNTSSE